MTVLLDDLVLGALVGLGVGHSFGTLIFSALVERRP
jgi:hypothetical protein